jgi:hypothetical protein
MALRVVGPIVDVLVGFLAPTVPVGVTFRLSSSYTLPLVHNACTMKNIARSQALSSKECVLWMSCWV